MSSDRNQIYEVKNGGLERLAADMGNTPMTESGTLAGFIQWCAQRYTANRNILILWDHGEVRLPDLGMMKSIRAAAA